MFWKTRVSVRKQVHGRLVISWCQWCRARAELFKTVSDVFSIRFPAEHQHIYHACSKIGLIYEPNFGTCVVNVLVLRRKSDWENVRYSFEKLCSCSTSLTSWNHQTSMHLLPDWDTCLPKHWKYCKKFWRQPILTAASVLAPCRHTNGPNGSKFSRRLRKKSRGCGAQPRSLMLFISGLSRGPYMLYDVPTHHTMPHYPLDQVLGSIIGEKCFISNGKRKICTENGLNMRFI